MKVTVRIILAVIVMAALILSGCSGPASSTATTDQTAATQTSQTSQTTPTSSAAQTASSQAAADSDIVKGGTLRIINGVGVTNMGYPSNTVTGGDLVASSPAVETLLRMDHNGLPTPWLATAWEVSPDNQWMTLTLRQGVKFQDGTDFNAEAVKFNLDFYLDNTLKNVSSVEVLDDYTVRLNFNEFWASIYNSLTWDAGRMLSPTAIQTHEKEWLYDNPVGTGPFTLVSFSRDVAANYTKWDGYWQEGKPYLDKIEISFVVDYTVSLMALKSGQADVDIFMDPRDAEGLQNEGFTVTKVAGAVIYIAGDTLHADSPFADIRVRQAIAYALPKEQLPGLVGWGSSAADQMTFPESWSYNPDVVDYSYDPDKAKQLLAEAGYPNGFDTTIHTHEYIEKDAWTAIQGWLKAVGINAELDVSTWGRFSEILYTQGWQSSLISGFTNASPGINPVANFLDFLSDGGSQTPISLSFPQEYMDLLHAAQKEPDTDKAAVSAHEMMRILTEDALVTPLYVYYMCGAKNPEVHNCDLYNYTSHLWTPEDAWLSK